MAKAEQTYSAAGKTIKHFENKPFAKGDYDLTLLEKGMEVRKSQEKGPDAIPYIGCRFEAEGTAAKEGQKNRLVFKNFFLSLQPGKDGVINVERGGGLAEFYRARGAELEGIPLKTLKLETPLPDGTDEVQYLDPEPILEQLKEWAGTTTRAHVVIEPGKDRAGVPIPNDPGKNAIQKFLFEDASEGEQDDAPEPVRPAKANGLKPAKKR